MCIQQALIIESDDDDLPVGAGTSHTVLKEGGPIRYTLLDENTANAIKGKYICECLL